MPIKNKKIIVIIDVDGVMTNGKFGYSEKGKIIKFFGADDNDALKILEDYVYRIIFVTGDKKGFKISKKRIVDHMGYKLKLVSTINRIDWIKKNFKVKDVIYIGDGIFDSLVFKNVGYSITVANALNETKNEANFVTKRDGGDRAIAEAVIHILKKKYKIKNIFKSIKKNKKFSGSWVH